MAGRHRANGLWQNPRLVRVLAAFLLYGIVEQAVWVAILLWAYEAGGSGLAGLVAVCQLVPAALLAPALSTIGDRLRTDRALALGYGSQAVLIAAAGGLLLADAPTGAVVACATAATVAISATRPVTYAAVPVLSGSPEQMVRANSLCTFIEGLGYALGPLLAGLVAAASDVSVTLLVCAAMVAVAAVLVAEMGMPKPLPSVHEGTPAGEAVRGLGVVARDPAAMLLLLFIGAGFVVTGALEVLSLSFADQVLGSAELGTGALVAAAGVGGLLGAGATHVLAGRRRMAPAVVVGGLLSLPLVAMAVITWLPTALLVVALSGVGQAFLNVGGRTLLQRTMPGDVLARVFGVQEAVLLGGLAGGSALAPLLVGAFGPARAYVPVGLGITALALLTWPAFAALDRRAVLRPVEVSLMRRVPFLRVLPLPALERLAQEAAWRELAADRTVVAQGEPGDAFFVVADGELSVTVDGRPRQHTIQAGTGFGEIALIQDVPRTATITTLTPTRLLVLSREPFLAAVTGSSRGADLAREMAVTHLARDRTVGVPQQRDG